MFIFHGKKGKQSHILCINVKRVTKGANDYQLKIKKKQWLFRDLFLGRIDFELVMTLELYQKNTGVNKWCNHLKDIDKLDL